MNLIQEIEQKKKDYYTDGYPISIGELINLYQENEIIIDPEFQRYFRWTDYQKTRFIESILLGIPIPSVFVYQRNDGIWELVDGLQRLSTIFQFVGILKSENNRDFKLLATEILPSLKGIHWGKDEDLNSFPKELKLAFKRSKLDVKIIKKESDNDAKFDVFERLNTGGSFLSPQEVRNCLFVMLDRDMYYWFRGLGENETFKKCINISDRLIQEQYNLELVLRYLACMKYKYDKKDLGQFLSESLKDIIKSKTLDIKNEKRKFEKIFVLLNQALGGDCFKKYNGIRFEGKFLESAYEAITLGLGENIEQYTDDDVETIATKIKQMWNNSVFLNLSGSGSNARTRIPKLQKFGRDYFKNGK